MKPLLAFLALALSLTSLGQPSASTTKPWTYWWWMGSAVDSVNISDQLEQFSKAGLGGVHIIPIYGVKGYENQFKDFLSEDWMRMVSFTIDRATSLGLGVDLSLGTGWPYGGSMVTQEMAAKRLDTRNISGKMKEVPVIPTLQKVKRAAPGGEGWVLDYFDQKHVQAYLTHFDSVFQHSDYPIRPRAFYHDSYEVYGADWTNNYPNQFEDLMGYDVIPHLPLLNELDHPDRPYILHDLRAALAHSLETQFTKTWTEWSHQQGHLSRNQAHGSPANILDLYALADIPETESFGCSAFNIPGLSCDPDYQPERFGRPSPLMMKFASSPAHLLGKTLVSSETATWLGNHFKVSLQQVKPQVDELFIAGINHIFYHGTTYSPKEEPWPGWLFYASTNFGPSAHFWDELPLLNQYIQTCQTELQASKPDNDVLLYFPIHDLWTNYPGNVLLMLDVHKYSRWFSATPFGEIAQLLWDQGYCFDYISDQQLINCDLSAYTTVVIPPTKYMPLETMKRLHQQANLGFSIVFSHHLPDEEGGLRAHQSPNPEFDQLREVMSNESNIQISSQIVETLAKLPVRKETIKQQGLDFIRKKTADGQLYFITNFSDQFYDDSIQLASSYQSLRLTKLVEGRTGKVQSSGKFRMQLQPGASCLIHTIQKGADEPDWINFDAQDSLQIDGPWTVSFQHRYEDIQIPIYTRNRLNSWTEWGDSNLLSFCGKALFSNTFQVNKAKLSSSFKLRLEGLHESARVVINNTDCGTVWCLPFELDIPSGLIREENTIEIDVQNLSANYLRRIDAKRPGWKKFYDINFADITYQPFDATNWDLSLSGLIGKIWLINNY